MQQGAVADLTTSIALDAARTSIALGLPMADSIMLASARRLSGAPVDAGFALCRDGGRQVRCSQVGLKTTNGQVPDLLSKRGCGLSWAPTLDGGFTVLELPSRDEAIAWAARFAKACRCDSRRHGMVKTWPTPSPEQGRRSTRYRCSRLAGTRRHEAGWNRLMARPNAKTRAVRASVARGPRYRRAPLGRARPGAHARRPGAARKRPPRRDLRRRARRPVAAHDRRHARRAGDRPRRDPARHRQARDRLSGRRRSGDAGQSARSCEPPTTPRCSTRAAQLAGRDRPGRACGGRPRAGARPARPAPRGTTPKTSRPGSSSTRSTISTAC